MPRALSSGAGLTPEQEVTLGLVPNLAAQLDATGDDGGLRLRGPYIPPPSAPALIKTTRLSTSPVISRGGVGTWNAGSVRDPAVFRVGARFYCVFTGASSAGSPFNPQLGLAWSDDGGFSWTTAPDPIVPPFGEWGGVFSPCAWVEGGKVYLFVSVIELPAQWYSGPISIAVVAADLAADLTSADSWAPLHGGAAIITTSQAWEGTQGVYAPSVTKRDGQYVLAYSSSSGSAPWRIGEAYADTIDSATWTKNVSNPLLGSAPESVEEPDILRLPDGTELLFADRVEQIHGRTWFHRAPGGTWAEGGDYLTSGHATWEGGVVGSSGSAWRDDGTILQLYGGKPSGAPTDARDIGVVALTFAGTYAGLREEITDLEARVEELELNTGGGEGGAVASFTPYAVTGRPSPVLATAIYNSTYDQIETGDGYRWIDPKGGTSDLRGWLELLFEEGEGTLVQSALGVYSATFSNATWSGGGLAFNGSTSMGLIDQSVSLAPPLTLVAVVQRTTGAQFDTIVTSGFNALKWGFTTGDQQRIDRSRSANIATGTTTYAASSAWRFVAVTLAPDGTTTFYNSSGPETPIAGAIGGLLTSPQATWLGRDGGGNSDPLAGGLAYFGASNRLLSAAQIARLCTQVTALLAASPRNITVT